MVWNSPIRERNIPQIPKTHIKKEQFVFNLFLVTKLNWIFRNLDLNLPWKNINSTIRVEEPASNWQAPRVEATPTGTVWSLAGLVVEGKWKSPGGSDPLCVQLESINSPRYPCFGSIFVYPSRGAYKYCDGLLLFHIYEQRSSSRKSVVNHSRLSTKANVIRF